MLLQGYLGRGMFAWQGWALQDDRQAGEENVEVLRSDNNFQQYRGRGDDAAFSVKSTLSSWLMVSLAYLGAKLRQNVAW